MSQIMDGLVVRGLYPVVKGMPYLSGLPPPDNVWSVVDHAPSYVWSTISVAFVAIASILWYVMSSAVFPMMKNAVITIDTSFQKILVSLDKQLPMDDGTKGKTYGFCRGLINYILIPLVHIGIHFCIGCLIFLYYIFKNFIYIIVLVALMYVFMGLEYYQTPAIQTADVSWSIARSFFNIAGTGANVLIEFTDALYLPIHNLVVKFLVSILRIVAKHIEEIIGYQDQNNGRRLDGVADDIAGGLQDTNEWIQTIFAWGKLIVTTICMLLELLLGVALAIFEFCVIFIQVIIEWIIFIALTPFCALSNFPCFLLELAYISANTIFSLIEGLINATGFISINLTGLLDGIQCRDGWESPEDCVRCRPLFKKWTCPADARRLLSCDWVGGKWQESGMNLKPSRRSVKIHEGCPHTKRAFSGRGRTMNVFHLGVTECYYLNINKTTGDLKVCSGEVSHAAHSTHGRTLDSKVTATSQYISSLMNERIEIVSHTFESQLFDNSNTPRLTYAEFKKELSIKRAATRNMGIVDCDSHSYTLEESSLMFNTLCYFQLISLNVKESAMDRLLYMRRRMEQKAEPVITKFITKHYNRIASSVDRIRLNSIVVNSMAAGDTFLHEFIPHHEPIRRHLETFDELKAIGPDSASCPSGYTLCPDLIYCEPVNACLCKVTKWPTLNTTLFHNQVNPTFIEQMYTQKCDLITFDPVKFFSDVNDCWNRMDRNDEITYDFTTAKSTANANQNEANFFANRFNPIHKLYCFPMVESFPTRIPIITYDLVSSVQDSCSNINGTETEYRNAIKLCVCPEYLNEIFQYDAWWLNGGVSLALHDRLWNGMIVFKTIFCSLVNWITVGIANAIWSGFWGIFPGMPEWFVTLFDATLGGNELACAFLHFGSFLYAIFFIGGIVFLYLAFKGFFYLVLMFIVSLIQCSCNRRAKPPPIQITKKEKEKDDFP